MTPQFVDLNADGIKDMVMATFEGTAFFVEGTPDGYKPPTHILDGADSMVRISMYWDLEAEEYQNVDRSIAGEDNIEQHHMTSIALVDWDEDGDLDLILGAYEGALYLCMNEGDAHSPRFATNNLRIKADGEHALITGGLATPRVCDWNGDGLFDILCGGSEGGVTWLQNVGKKGEPQFAASQTLVAKTTGRVEVEDDPNGYLANRLVPEKDGLPTCPGTGFHIEPVDYDGDGDLDLLVGAQSYCKAVEKGLTPEEQKELKEIETKIEELSAKRDEMIAAVDEEKMKELYESEQFQKDYQELVTYYRRQSALLPGPTESNLIWLYRNNGSSSDTNSPESRDSKPLTTQKPKSTEADDSEKKLTVTTSFEPAVAAAGDEVTLNIKVQIPEGYHIYGSEHDVSPTTVTMTNLGGLAGDLAVPVPEGYVVVNDESSGVWLHNVVSIQSKFKVPDGFTAGMVTGELRYTLCNDKLCDPPATRKFTATLKVR